MSNKEKLIDETVSKLLDLYLRSAKSNVDVSDFARQFMDVSKPMIDKYNEELMGVINPFNEVVAPILAFVLKATLDIVQQDFDEKDKMIVEALEGSCERVSMKLPEELMF